MSVVVGAVTVTEHSLVAVAKQTRSRVKSLASTIGQTQSPAYYDEIDGDIFLAGNSSPALAPVLPAKPQVAALPPVPPQAPPPARPVDTTPAAAPSQDFIFPDSDRVRLTRDMVARLAPAQLRIARNEIFARRGRYFRDPALAAHFARFNWYRPYAWDVPLNATEQANISLIASFER